MTEQISKDLVLDRARDWKFWDIKSKEYLDFTSGGIFTSNLGIWDPKWEDALTDQIHNLPTSYTYRTEIREAYEKKLLEVTGFEGCAFFSDGTTAVEAALRVLSFGSDKYISGIEDCFHGKSYGPTHTLYRYDFDEIRNFKYWKDYVWLIEGYRGWDAYFWPEWFIERMKEVATLCVDEIQSGFGRTGKFFAYEHYGLDPDIVVVGKAMANGFPMSGILVKDKSWLEGVDLSSTFGGNPMACAAGLATLEEFERLDLVAESARKGSIFHGELKKLPTHTQGKGMVAAVLFSNVQAADDFVISCAKKGLLVVHTGKNTVKLGPCLTMPDEEIIRGCEILREVCNGFIYS